MIPTATGVQRDVRQVARDSRSNHVLAGDIVAPLGTRPVEDAIMKFVTSLR